ncbi:MAG: hypothetical protein RLZZ369_2428 [Pseudomonadota bacterium]
MVKPFIVSEYSSNPPTETGRVKIAVGPLYELKRVQALLQGENRLQAWTEKCRKDVRKWFDEGVSGMLITLTRSGVKTVKVQLLRVMHTAIT